MSSKLIFEKDLLELIRRYILLQENLPKGNIPVVPVVLWYAGYQNILQPREEKTCKLISLMLLFTSEATVEAEV